MIQRYRSNVAIQRIYILYPHMNVRVLYRRPMLGKISLLELDKDTTKYVCHIVSLINLAGSV